MKKTNYILSLDIGTTGTKGLLCTIDGKIECTASKSHTVYYVGPGMVEQDPQEVFEAALEVMRSILEKSRIDPAKIAALVFGGVLHSLIPVDREGHPLHRALIWADSRSIEQTRMLQEKLDVREIKRRTGCTIHPLYFPPRLLYFKQKMAEIVRKTYKYISIKEYILYHLYGDFIVDLSIASGTGIWNVETLNWDKAILNTLGIGEEKFSQIIETTCILKSLKREYADKSRLVPGTPAVIGAFDGALAHLGSAGLNERIMSITVGSTAAMRRKVPSPRVIENGEAWCYYMVEGNWVLGGVIHDAGAVIKWLSEHIFGDEKKDRALFRLLNKYAAEIRPGSDGLLFFPFLAGERCPHNNPDIKGAILGLSFIHDKRHLVRALMEGIAYRLYTIYQFLTEGQDMELVMSGGILGSSIWLQTIADFFGKDLLIPEVAEASAWGGFLLALRALGVVDSLDELDHFIRHKKDMIKSRPEAHRIYEKSLRRYNELYEKLFR